MGKNDYIVLLPERSNVIAPGIVYDATSPDCAVSRYIARINSDLPRDKKSRTISKTMRSLRERVDASGEAIAHKKSLTKYVVRADELMEITALSHCKGNLRDVEEIPYDSVTPGEFAERLSRNSTRKPDEFLGVAREYVNYYKSL